MNINSARRRKAISPVLATVILIAITLIAAIAIAGFVFGLFGSFTSSARVSAQVTTCVVSTKTCTVLLTNTGTSNANALSCSIQDNGAPESGTLGGGPTVPAGQAGVSFTCLLGTIHSVAGSTAEGSFAMSNGATVPFSGVWT